MLVRDAMSTGDPDHRPRPHPPPGAGADVRRAGSARRSSSTPILGLGILTERDILNAVGAGLSPDQETAGAHTTTDVVFAAPRWTLEEAATAMVHGGFRHLSSSTAGTRPACLGPRHHPAVGPVRSAAPAGSAPPTAAPACDRHGPPWRLPRSPRLSGAPRRPTGRPTAGAASPTRTSSHRRPVRPAPVRVRPAERLRGRGWRMTAQRRSPRSTAARTDRRRGARPGHRTAEISRATPTARRDGRIGEIEVATDGRAKRYDPNPTALAPPPSVDCSLHSARPPAGHLAAAVRTAARSSSSSRSRSPSVRCRAQRGPPHRRLRPAPAPPAAPGAGARPRPARPAPPAPRSAPASAALAPAPAPPAAPLRRRPAPAGPGLRPGGRQPADRPHRRPAHHRRPARVPGQHRQHRHVGGSPHSPSPAASPPPAAACCVRTRRSCLR